MLQYLNFYISIRDKARYIIFSVRTYKEERGYHQGYRVTNLAINVCHQLDDIPPNKRQKIFAKSDANFSLFLAFLQILIDSHCN